MNPETIDAIRNVFAEVSHRPLAEVTPASRISEDLGLDSLDCVEVAMYLENVLNLILEDEKIVASKTVQDVADYIATL